MVITSGYTMTYIEIGLSSIVYDWTCVVESLHHVVQHQVINSMLKVGLLCINQHPHSKTTGTLEGVIN